MKEINTTNAPKAVGHYNQAIQVGNIVYCSGQIPIDPATGELALYNNDAAKQAALVLKNLAAVLKSAGGSMNDVAKVTIFVANMDDFAKINDIYATAFGSHKPARACVQVARLPKDVLVEMDAIAHIESL
ncbi:MAG: hypothetical protein COV45_04060 [Deltaproteobacteria bacterium CG11_big_fil_rev_8_21_14_0_20_47_16]|nr:MAG: hypothetical protein COV45_04060 [Deltaproteobacteria bacterium CG11_big_fil_rev_8_21_14_0_20_47_16]